MAFTVAGDLIFFGDVFAEFLLSLRAFAFSAACADAMRAVADDPHGLLIFVPSPSFKVKPCPFCWPHFFRISFMACSVVNCLLAIVSICKLPRRASARRALAPIDPSGNASLAATSRRSGVVGRIASGRKSSEKVLPLLPVIALAFH